MKIGTQSTDGTHGCALVDTQQEASGLPVTSIANVNDKTRLSSETKMASSHRWQEEYSSVTPKDLLEAAKAWGTQDIDLVSFVCCKLESAFSNKRIKPCQISPEEIYFHRSQRREFTDLINKKISNIEKPLAMEDHSSSVSGINAIVSLEKVITNPYHHPTRNVGLFFTLADVLNNKGKAHNDDRSNSLGALLIELPEGATMQFTVTSS